jgi:hypothetical protein
LYLRIIEAPLSIHDLFHGLDRSNLVSPYSTIDKLVFTHRGIESPSVRSFVKRDREWIATIPNVEEGESLIPERRILIHPFDDLSILIHLFGERFKRL